MDLLDLICTLFVAVLKGFIFELLNKELWGFVIIPFGVKSA